jgi:bifunctional DNA-binding transcriptional regulator/antitoxin component of YhaV-PrlF toxin-antitoxin module
MAVKVKTKGEKKVKAVRRGRQSTSKLSTKNQLTVPVDILRQVGITVGDQVEFSVNDAGFIEIKAVEVNNLMGLSEKYGYLFKGFDLAKERETWNR